MRERYQRDPVRFRAQLAFYDSLEARFPRAQTFHSAGGPGPDIVIYRNPRWAAPFFRRRDQPIPDSSLVTQPTLSGGESFFYYNLGLNYESFGYLNQALAAYLDALRPTSIEADTYASTAARLAGVLVKQGRAPAAEAFLRQAVAHAPTPAAAATLERLRGYVASTSAAQAP